MEPPLKLAAPLGSQNVHNNAHCGGGLSDLPAHIVHHILSLLHMTDIAFISILSKRCRELCMSAPNLNIDSEILRGSLVRRQRFGNFLDRFMNLCNGMEVQTFRLRWIFSRAFCILNEEYRVDTWLHNVVRRNVKELYLDLHPMDRIKAFELPLCIFSCGSLRVLNLNLNNGILKLPSVGFTTLQDLTLSGVRIGHNDFGGWVSSLCKSLMRLNLINVWGINSLSITTSSLQCLTITVQKGDDLHHINVSAEKLHTMILFWGNTHTGKSLHVSAPNLRVLSLDGHNANYYCLANFLHVHEAWIYCLTTPPQACSDWSFFQVIRCISQVKSLYIGGKFIQSLITHGFPQTTLRNLHSLFLTVRSLEDDLVPSIASFLGGLPSLQKLAIKPKFLSAPSITNNTLPLEASGFDAEYWESQNLVFVQKLKEAAIEIHSGENEMQLVKYLLKHAKALEKITIFCSSLEFCSAKENSPLTFPKLHKISKRIEEFKKASSTAAVYLLLK
ncbi:hypothetical protein L1049_024761 [Liquidambar formosana]|uniref:F-box domain-containing protein n=1 Tax=Liquidambar formosana TaxID=63359 RepID=A0AAP0S076_LIQFO